MGRGKIYTEGVPGKKINSFRKFPQPLIINGRPLSVFFIDREAGR